MINPTTYLRPKTLSESLHKLNQPECTALAGGGLLLRGVLLPYATLIDMQDLLDFKGIHHDDARLIIGGITSLEAVFTSDYVLPRLRDSIGRLLTINQRNGITVGESLTVPDAPLEWLSALVALGARVDHVGFEKGRLTEDAYVRQSMADFLVDVHKFGQPYAGFVKAVYIPIATGRAGLGSAFVARTPRDIPIVNASAFITLGGDDKITQAHVIIAGASRETLIMSLNTTSLIGQSADETTFREYASGVPHQVEARGDYRGSEAYRQAMSEVVVRRALLDASGQVK